MTYRFEGANQLTLLKDGRPFLSGISLYLERENGEKIPLAYTGADDREARFEGPLCRAGIQITELPDGLGLSAWGELILDQKNGAFLDDADQNLSSRSALTIVIASVKDAGRYNACYSVSAFWCAAACGSTLQKVPAKSQALLMERGREYLYILTLCDERYKSVLAGCEEGLRVSLTSCKRGETSLNSRALVLVTDPDPYVLPEKAVGCGYAYLNKPYATRSNRRYPEIFEYLGWCSWDAFPLCVNHQGLLDKAEEFRQKEIPVRFAIVDDMWAQLKHEDTRETMHANELSSLESDPERFPKGLKAAITELKDTYGLQVGVWHPVTGYWHGIDPDGELARRWPDLLCRTEDGRLVVDPSPEKAYLFHERMYRYLKECGADFVKVDNQSSLEWFYKKLGFIGEIAQHMHTAIEAACGVYFDGAIINCMGCATENIWNRPNSLINRCSNDFLPEDRLWFIRHILQASFTAYHHGGFTQGDFDMFWTDDAQAVKNSVLRAISGGPVYISDKLGRSQRDVILPMVLSDGRILRCQNPAVPTRDCLMRDPETSGSIFKVWNRTENGGVIAAYNLDKEEKPVSGAIYARDIEGFETGSYAVLDYFAQKLTILEADQPLTIKLDDYDQYKLYTIVPIEGRVTPLGLLNKYVSSAAFHRFGENRYTVLDAGPFGFVCSDPAVRVLCDGQEMPVQTGDGYRYIDISTAGSHIVEFEL